MERSVGFLVKYKKSDRSDGGAQHNYVVCAINRPLEHGEEKLFFSHNDASQLIQGGTERRCGRIVFYPHENPDTLRVSFFPLGHEKIDAMGLVSQERKAIVGQGIASNAELLALMHLKEQVGGSTKILHSVEGRENRESHLIATDRWPQEKGGNTIDSEIENLAAFVERKKANPGKNWRR